MIISPMPLTPPAMRTESTVIYNFPRESGYDKTELRDAVNLNFGIGRGDWALSAILNRLEEMSHWPAGWNGYDAASPNHNAINHAKSFVQQIYLDALAMTEKWHDPHVTADANGDVVFEWWKNDKKLTIYISANQAEYVKVWGANIMEEMADGDADTSNVRRVLWQWLMD